MYVMLVGITFIKRKMSKIVSKYYRICTTGVSIKIEVASRFE